MSGDVRGLYAAIGVELPARGGTNIAVQCFTNEDAHRNGDRHPSCSVNVESGAFLCHACGARGGPYDAALAKGCSPRDAMELLRSFDLVSDDAHRGAPGRPPRPATPRPPIAAPSGAQLAEWRTSLRSNEPVIARLLELRGWTLEAIVALGLGLDQARIVFAVTNRDGQVVGVERYQPNSALVNPHAKKMICLPGSDRDLFPSPEGIPAGAVTLIVEGRADAVSARSLGFAAVSVSGTSGWRTEWAPRFAGLHAVICCDCDAPGRRLAGELARDLPAHAASIRVLDLDPVRADGYDVTDFLLQHGLSGLEQARALLSRAIALCEPLPRPGQDCAVEDFLGHLPAADGVALLSGASIPRGGVTILCPSCGVVGLHLPPVGVVGCAGWWCESCRTHGRTLDLAAVVWRLDPINDRDELVKRCAGLLLAPHKEAA